MRKPRASLASKKRKALAAAGREEEGSSSGGSKSPEELQKESNKGAARGKRVKAAKPKPETEYLPEKRNMEDLWQAAFPVGTESIFLCGVKNAFEEGGELSGKTVYMFGSTEGKFFWLSQMLAVNGEEKVVLIPIVVASNTVVTALQTTVAEVADNNVSKQQRKLRRLSWRLSKTRFTASALRHLKVERVKQYDYCLPCAYEFTDSLISEETLSEDKKDEFKAKEARKKAIEDMDPKTKAAFENMKFYKFYPVQTPDTPDISKVKVAYINRYYGKAHFVR
ncbi:hypothetical protein BHE74_00025953 [Ensete ventricosum]|nr:hypothetical protein BHE74_00025953 [Ensete ventricosum]